MRRPTRRVQLPPPPTFDQGIGEDNPLGPLTVT